MGLPMFTGKDGRCTDIQMVVLNGILTMNNVDYRTLAAEALGIHQNNVPGKYSLKYEQATTIIHYGNEIYRM
jgi:hypothetical protein